MPISAINPHFRVRRAAAWDRERASSKQSGEHIAAGHLAAAVPGTNRQMAAWATPKAPQQPASLRRIIAEEREAESDAELREALAASRREAEHHDAKLTAVLRASRIVDAGTEPADSAADADADDDASLALDAELR